MTQVCEISNTELSVKGSFALSLVFQDLSFKGFPSMLLCTGKKKMRADAVNWLKGELQPVLVPIRVSETYPAPLVLHSEKTPKY